MGDRFSGFARFVAELRRRRVFRVAAVYAVAGWVVIQGSSAILPTLEAPLWVGKVVLVLVALGFVLAVALAWAFDVTPAGIVRTSDADARAGPGEADLPVTAERPASLPGAAPPRPSYRRARAVAFLGVGLILAVAALGAYAALFRSSAARREVPITSVAVLPFSNLSRDPENEYFSDGLADELLDHLAKVPGLNVAARTSSFYFKDKNLPVKEIARRLEVEAVLEGSVQRTGGRIRLTAQLISGRTGYHLWSESYDREAGDLFAIEDEISRAIASALRVKLVGAAPARVHVPDSAAHDLYLRGRFLLNRGSRADVERAIELFQQAIERDSAYAEAYAAAADAWEGWFADAYPVPLEVYAKAEALAQRALALDESNAEAHTDLAYARMIVRWDWAGAEREHRRALELNPKDPPSHVAYSWYLFMRGDTRRALAESREAARLEPFAAYYAWVPVWQWCMVGEVDSALAAYAHAREVAPADSSGSAPSCYYRAKGQYAEALALDRAAALKEGVPTFDLVLDLVGLGRRPEAEAAFGEMVAASKHRYLDPNFIAVAAMVLGHRDLALQWLERGVDLHYSNAPLVTRFREFRPLRSDPRYQRLLRRMGLETAPP